MQVDKIGSNQAFGAKLKLYGVNRKHWNLSTEEIKKLATKAEEIETSKDKVFSHFFIILNGCFNLSEFPST